MGNDKRVEPINPSSYQVSFTVKEWMYEVFEAIYKERSHSRRGFHFSMVIISKILLTPAHWFQIPCSNETVQMYAILAVRYSIRYLKGFLPTQPSDEEIYSFCAGAYTVKQYYISELDVEKLEPLKNVHLALDVVDVYFFSPFGKQETETVVELAYVLVDSYMLYFHLTNQDPREIAASCIALSRRLVHKDESTMWNSEIANLTGVPSIEAMKNIFQEVNEVAYDIYKLTEKAKRDRDQAHSQSNQQIGSPMIIQ